jgi:hypothetical protein
MTTAVASQRFAKRAGPDGFQQPISRSEGETLAGSLWSNGRALYQVVEESDDLVTLFNIDTGMPKCSLSIQRGDLPELFRRVKGWILYTR